MTWLTSSLPVRDGVAVFAALKHEAARLVAAGDPRSRGQIMADTLVSRVLGGVGSDRAVPPLAVNVVIGVDALLGASDEPATIPGYGPISADLVREWIRDGMAAGVEVTLRRLFAEPTHGALVAMESSRRAFDGALADLIELRDQQCRTPLVRRSRSATRTTSSRPVMVARPVLPTDRACASPATTPRKRWAGRRGHGRAPGTRSR